MGDWRFDYQLKPRRKFSDIKRVPQCVSQHPDATKDVDHRFLLDRAARPALGAALYELLDTLADSRTPHAARASSSGVYKGIRPVTL